MGNYKIEISKAVYNQINRFYDNMLYKYQNTISIEDVNR